MNKFLASFLFLLALCFALPGRASGWDLTEPASPLLIAVGLACLAAIIHLRNRK